MLLHRGLHLLQHLRRLLMDWGKRVHNWLVKRLEMAKQKNIWVERSVVSGRSRCLPKAPGYICTLAMVLEKSCGICRLGWTMTWLRESVLLTLVHLSRDLAKRPSSTCTHLVDDRHAPGFLHLPRHDAVRQRGGLL